MAARQPRSAEQLIQTIGLPGDGQGWGGLNKYDINSAITIQDAEFNECLNWLPMGNSLRQVPGNSAPMATLASTVLWASAQTLNLAQYIYCLCANGHIYQVSLGGAIIDVGGATTFSAQADITNWQGTTILISDLPAAKVYSWNGSVFATVFNAQPVATMAVFNARLWMANQNTVTFTAGGTFNSLGGDAGSFLITDSTCQPPIVALYPFGGLLYIFGYDWIQTLGNVISIGTPAVTVFQVNTLESRIGTNTRWSIAGLGSVLYFSNFQGIWQLQGSFPTKVSKPIDGFFQNLGVTSSYSVAFGYIYNEPCLFWNVQWATTPTETTVFGLTSAGQWFRTVLGNESFITSDIDQTTGASKVFGVSGTSLFQMYSNTTSMVTSTLVPKWFSFGSFAVFKRMYKLGLVMWMGSTATVNIDWRDQNGQLIVALPPYAFSNQVIFVDHGGNPITWRNAANTAFVTWTSLLPATFNFLDWNVDNISRLWVMRLIVAGSGNVLASINMEVESSEARWGP